MKPHLSGCDGLSQQLSHDSDPEHLEETLSIFKMDNDTCRIMIQ